MMEDQWFNANGLKRTETNLSKVETCLWWAIAAMVVVVVVVAATDLSGHVFSAARRATCMLSFPWLKGLGSKCAG